jgi:hypothetical protein
MSDPVTWGLIISAAVGAGSSAYSAHEQREAQREAMKRQTEADKLAEEQAKAAAQLKYSPKTATLTPASDINKSLMTTADLLIPLGNSLGSPNSKSGLGF